MNLLESRNSLLGMEFDRHLREYPEFTDKIPENAQVIILLEGDKDFNTWSMRVGKKQAPQNQPLLYVTIKKLAPAHSRIEELRLGNILDQQITHVLKEKQRRDGLAL